MTGDSDQEMPVTEVQETADSLTPGDQVVLNDRKRPLTVTDRHTRAIQKAYRRRRGDRDHQDVVELEGNGTTYHLLWHHGSDVGPMLYREAEWRTIDTAGSDDPRYDYSRGGTRVRSITTVDPEQDSGSSSGIVGPIIFANRTARGQLLNKGEVVSFRASDRTTGETWWRRSRTGEKMGDVRVEQIGGVTPDADSLSPYQDKSGFQSTEKWIDAIEDENGQLPDTGFLYRVRATEGQCGKCGKQAPLPTNGFCPPCEREEARSI